MTPLRTSGSRRGKGRPAMLVVWALAAVTAVMLQVTAAGAQQAQAEAGLDLARRLCSNCHMTDLQGAATAHPGVPSFAVIAASPRTSPERLAAAIILPHPEMPGIALTRAEIRALIDYIMSLRKEPSAPSPKP